MIADFDDDHTPKEPDLQLETSGGGPSFRIRTALGTYDGGRGFDSSLLPNPPWYFSFFSKAVKKRYKSQLARLPLDEALSLLREAGVPPLYQLALGLHWGFLDQEREHFSVIDLGEILMDLELLRIPIHDYLERMETQASYHLWMVLSV